MRAFILANRRHCAFVALTFALSLALVVLLARTQFGRLSPANILSILAWIVAGIVVDRFVFRQREHVETRALKLSTLRATMRTVQLIVNNFFNNLLLIEMELKDVLPSDSVNQLESGMQETFKELKALGDLQSVEEVPFAMGPLISYRTQKARV